MRPALVAMALWLAPSTPVAALDLVLRDFYDLNRPASLEFDPDFCGLWIANEGPEVVLVTLDGLELRRFGSDLYRIKAVALDGPALLVADGNGRFQRLSRDGAALAPPFGMATGPYADTEGLAVADDGTLIAVEDEPGHILWIAPEGGIVHRVDGLSLTPPMTEPQGIARDPRNGRLLVVDDWEGTNSLFEFTADGALIATFPLIQFGYDPEGIALRASTSTLFIAFDGGARIAAFDYVPSPGADEPADDATAECVIS